MKQYKIILKLLKEILFAIKSLLGWIIQKIVISIKKTIL